jgi:hypothetical protein
VVTAATVGVVLAIFVWDGVQGVVKARQAQAGIRTKVPGAGVHV